jgi:hypothetical protein
MAKVEHPNPPAAPTPPDDLLRNIDLFRKVDCLVRMRQVKVLLPGMADPTLSERVMDRERMLQAN